jgi:hypothetical protein
MAVRRVGQGVSFSVIEQMHYGTLLIGCQKSRFNRRVDALLLSEEQVFMLNNGPPNGSMDFRRQAVLLVEPQAFRLAQGGSRGYTIQRVVVITTQHSF